MQQQLYCPRCHQPVQPGQRFCNNCDFDLTSETPAHKTQPATGSPLVPLICPSCGASLPLPATNAEYLICPYCGKTFYLRRSANGVSLELVRQVEQDLAKQLRQQQTEQQLQMLKMEEEQVLNELTALKGMPQTPQRDQSIAALTKRLKQLEREIHWQKPQTKI